MDSQFYKRKKCDVLIIGGGGSGVTASIEAAKHKDLKVILASKGPIGQSGLTPTANGGCRFSNSPDEMFNEMVQGGCFINDQNVVWFMVNEIRNSLQQLEQLGIPVTSLSTNTVHVPCIQSLVKIREKIIETPNCELLEDILITSLIMSDGILHGATALDLTTGDLFIIEATAIVIATGGLVGELYPNTSNNPFGITTDSSGTGHIMAYLAGAELVDMEMIQFVPLPANQRCFQLRFGPDFFRGPYLDCYGNVIESNVNSYPGGSYSYLLTQKLCKELEKGNGPIYIDQRDFSQARQLSGIKSLDGRRKLIKSLGIDPRENKIEITIGSHFGMGGIRVNEKTETTLPGLYAAGEIMGGVHGAMRLHGYSLSQIFVFGFEAGRQAAKYAKKRQKTQHIFNLSSIEKEGESVFQFLEPKSRSISVAELKRQLQHVMQEYVFILRDKAGIEAAIQQIKIIKKEIPKISVPDFKKYNLEWSRAIEFSLIIKAAEIIAQSALAREESRGSHYRRDFPIEDNEKWLKHTVARLDKGELRIDSAPIVFDRMKPEVSI